MESLETVLYRLLTANGKTLATAESCSGGLIAHRITNVSGASAYFLGGVVAYSNEAKVALLDVDRELLGRCGAVSEPVARAMAGGVRKRFGADFGAACTGIAGPGGGSPDKPVGLVYVAVALENEVRAIRRQFSGCREDVKKQTAEQVLSLLLESIS